MQRISKPKLLIGEGNEEVFFFEALLAHLGINNVNVESYGGKSKLRGYLKTFNVRPEHQTVISLGVTQDADNDAGLAFQNVRDSLSTSGLATPDAPGRAAGNSPQVRVLIIPDGSSHGILEDVCLAAIETNPELQCVDEYFLCLKNRANWQPKSMTRKSKARVHTWLSSQVEPDLRLGEAAKRGYLPWDSPAFDHIKQFLRSL